MKVFYSNKCFSYIVAKDINDANNALTKFYEIEEEGIDLVEKDIKLEGWHYRKVRLDDIIYKMIDLSGWKELNIVKDYEGDFRIWESFQTILDSLGLEDDEAFELIGDYSYYK